MWRVLADQVLAGMWRVLADLTVGGGEIKGAYGFLDKVQEREREKGWGAS